MDLLPSPIGGSMLGKAPYLGRNKPKWDGGQFLHYGCRVGKLGFVRPYRRECACSSPAFNFGQKLSPAELEERDSLSQTWLFFGLLAEFHGLNDAPADITAHRDVPIPNPQRDADIQALYESFIDSDTLTGASLLQRGWRDGAMFHRLKKLSRDKDAILQFNHLSRCLRLANGMLEYWSELTPPVAVPIAALGEWLDTFMCEVTAEPLCVFRSKRRTGGLPQHKATSWAVEFIRLRTDITKTMVASHWCPSDIGYFDECFEGLGLRHFISHLEKPPTSYRHDSGACSVQRCGAVQLDASTYRCSHVDSCRGDCPMVGVDEEEVRRILIESESFPILGLDVLDDGTVEIHVEEYTPDKPYVALSHVWADGLGNPNSNTLPSCQMAYLTHILAQLPPPANGFFASLVQRLHNLLNSYQPSTSQLPKGTGTDTAMRAGYWFWIDTLCCPISIAGKRRALERIATVYREAVHVLIVDKSISQVEAKEEGLAAVSETCLRILASSAWMRRLWTLQEGSLAKSLYFQFRNRPVHLAAELWNLDSLALQSGDLRYIRISKGVLVKASQFGRLYDPDDNQTSDPNELSSRLGRLQSALYFRSVSVASDEPLCLATLMGLDPAAVVGLTCGQERMAAVWRLIAEKVGGIPAFIIFWNDRPLTLASLTGWRWAPKSLLLPVGCESSLSYSMIAARWNFEDATDENRLGRVNAHGLSVRYRGMRITTSSLAKRLGPWSLLRPAYIKNMKTALPCRDRETGQWFYLFSVPLLGTASETQKRPGFESQEPLFKKIQAGTIFLIGCHEKGKTGWDCPYLLVRPQEDDADNDDSDDNATNTEGTALRVYADCIVALTECPRSHWPALGLLHRIAEEVAESDENKVLLGLWEREGENLDPQRDDCQHAWLNLMARLQAATYEAWDADGGAQLSLLFDDKSVQDMRQACWEFLLWVMPFKLSVEILSDGNLREWIVDRPAEGDGLCKEACCTAKA